MTRYKKEPYAIELSGRAYIPAVLKTDLLDGAHRPWFKLKLRENGTCDHGAGDSDAGPLVCINHLPDTKLRCIESWMLDHVLDFESTAAGRRVHEQLKVLGVEPPCLADQLNVLRADRPNALQVESP